MCRVNPDKGGRGRQRDAQRNRSSSGPGWTDFLQSAVQVPTWQCVSDRRAAVSSLALSPLASSEPLVQSHLPMWSSLRTSLAIIELRAAVGVLRRRSDALEYAAAQGSRGRVSTNVTV